MRYASEELSYARQQFSLQINSIQIPVGISFAKPDSKQTFAYVFNSKEEKIK